MKISLIMPVYNVEKYIRASLDSIVNQDTKDIEVIIIDDGTKDNSGIICDEYAKKYDFINVIHKQNEGVSVARNTGLKEAKGEYIMFLDSDDKLQNGIISEIKELIKTKEKIYTFEYEKIDEEEKKVDFEKPTIKKGIFSKRDFFKTYYSKYKILPWAIWMSVFRADIIKENNICFPAGIKAAEDTDFYFNYIRNVEEVHFVNKSIIHYRVNRTGSAMTNMKMQTVLDIFKIYTKHFYGNDKFVSRYFANFYVGAFNLIPQIKDENDRKKVIDSIDSKIIFKSTGLKFNIFKCMCVLIGKRKALNLFVKLKKKQN